MDPNNSQFILEDELNESNFTEVSSNATEMKKMADKIKKLEDMAVKNAKGSSIGDQSGMMFWQMGEKFGKMELKMDGISKENVELKEGMAKMMKHFEELKGENAEKDREIEGMKKKNIDRIVKMMKDFEELKGEVGKLSEENGKLKEENSEKSQEMEWMKKVIEGLKEQNGEMKEELAGNARVMREMQKKIAKLIMQIDGHYIEMEERIVENSHKIEELERNFKRLKNGNGIGAKNAELQGKIGELAKLTEQIGENEWVKYDWKAFKFNEMKCATKLTISEGGLFAKHSVPPNYTWNSVRTFWPIPTLNNFSSIITKPTFAFYFETEILNKPFGYIVIGFCGHEFPMEGKWLVNEKNSIGIFSKGGIWIDGTWNKFGNADGYFKNGDVIGIGIIHRPNSIMECFATWNGQLIGKIEIPPKFATFQLYPAASLYYTGESVRVNFDKENCQFKEFGRAIQ